MAGGDAGAAHGDELPGILPGEPFPPASLELGGGQETPIGAEIGSERMVDGAGHVSGDWVDGFDRAGEALRRARVHQEVSAGLQGALEVGGAEHGRGSTRGVKRAVRAVRAAASPDSTAPPAATQALKPPSRTATASCPNQRNIHHRRAAIDELASS